MKETNNSDQKRKEEKEAKEKKMKLKGRSDRPSLDLANKKAR